MCKGHGSRKKAFMVQGIIDDVVISKFNSWTQRERLTKIVADFGLGGEKIKQAAVTISSFELSKMVSH
jgi:hypothetical protein